MRPPIQMLFVLLVLAATAGCGQPASTVRTPAAVASDEATIRGGTILWIVKAEGLTDKNGIGDVGISGDLAWHAGTSSASDTAGKTVETGKYVEVWHRINGTWLMVRDIWKNDAAWRSRIFARLRRQLLTRPNGRGITSAEKRRIVYGFSTTYLAAPVAIGTPKHNDAPLSLPRQANCSV